MTIATVYLPPYHVPYIMYNTTTYQGVVLIDDEDEDFKSSATRRKKGKMAGETAENGKRKRTRQRIMDSGSTHCYRC